MRWIWIDYFEEFHSGQSARAVKSVSFAEDHIHDQYPGYPIFPISLIIEGLAQTGGILVGEANEFSEKVVLAKIPKVTFHDHAIVGDVLQYEVKMIELRFEGAIVEGRVFKDGKLMAEAEIVFAHLDKSRGPDDETAAKNFVFTKDHLMALLRMAQGSYQSGGKGVNRLPTEAAAAESHAGKNGRPQT